MAWLCESLGWVLLLVLVLVLLLLLVVGGTDAVDAAHAEGRALVLLEVAQMVRLDALHEVLLNAPRRGDDAVHQLVLSQVPRRGGGGGGSVMTADKRAREMMQQQQQPEHVMRRSRDGGATATHRTVMQS
jgi:hypothetical protein